MFDVVGLGELLVDFTFYGVSESGMGLFEQNPGGGVPNMLAACANLGLKTAFIGKVGADMHGEFLKETLQSKGIDTTGLLETPDVFTTLAFVKLTEGERSFSFARKPGADTFLQADELNQALLKSTKVFHFSSLSLTDQPARAATLEAVQIARESGAIIAFDPNYRAPLWKSKEEAVRNMRIGAGLADVIKISDEETALLTDQAEPDEAALALLEQGASCAVVTLGEKGAYARTRAGATQKQPPAPARIVDTTGAGDAFWGGFLHQIVLSGKKPGELGEGDLARFVSFANATASLCVEKRGAIPAMPLLSEVEARMRA